MPWDTPFGAGVDGKGGPRPAGAVWAEGQPGPQGRLAASSTPSGNMSLERKSSYGLA